MFRKLHLVWLLIAGCILYCLHSCNSAGQQMDEEQVPDTVSYNFNIRPILSDKCFKCHGPDAGHREADLRLDIPEIAYSALKDNPEAHALVPGDPDLSEVYRRISTKDTAEQMPPASSNLKKLSPFEVELVKKWIKQGAKYEKHWAL
jgi:hypothetical protein